jgi:hypothetical protein
MDGLIDLTVDSGPCEMPWQMRDSDLQVSDDIIYSVVDLDQA